MNKNYKIGFTLAEVLITLAIIGVVSALVIPTVIKNYNNKKYNTARLKALKTFGEAGKMASINDEMNSQDNAENFINNVLSKYLKITKVCKLANATDCGFPSQIQPSNPTAAKKNTTALAKWNQMISYDNNMLKYVSVPMDDSKMSIVVSTLDGFSALIHYNPECGRTSHDITYTTTCNRKECNIFSINATCMNVVYDMNGIKPPNHVGEDIGIVTVFWSGIKSEAVAPGIIPYSINTSGIIKQKTAFDPSICANKGTKKHLYSMPSVSELSALTNNFYLVSLPFDVFWSGSNIDGAFWTVNRNGDRYMYYSGDTPRVWCVRR